MLLNKTRMSYTYRILTLNINGIASVNRQHTLEEFIRKHDVDIAMLQEVTPTHNIIIKGYQTIDNIGTTGRGIAIIARDDLQMNGLRKIPSGRGIATTTYVS